MQLSLSTLYPCVYAFVAESWLDLQPGCSNISLELVNNSKKGSLTCFAIKPEVVKNGFFVVSLAAG